MDYENSDTSTCRIHNTNKGDLITCVRTVWKVRCVTSRVENKRGRVCRGLLRQSAVTIPAA
ncbi:unnamed protein product [Hymenolepis diminuta]|uniref:Uncharacterized protein n=1 Tax=Hymenolepis diminuta TaxID=6216 RepID=A0A564YM27_HYMDI|nr:unnamed protein product [Hymenolepis diminuta]